MPIAKIAADVGIRRLPKGRVSHHGASVVFIFRLDPVGKGGLALADKASDGGLRWIRVKGSVCGISGLDYAKANGARTLNLNWCNGGRQSCCCSRHRYHASLLACAMR